MPPDSLKGVGEHLDRCDACLEEFKLLLDGVQAADDRIGAAWRPLRGEDKPQHLFSTSNCAVPLLTVIALFVTASLSLGDASLIGRHGRHGGIRLHATSSCQRGPIFTSRRDRMRRMCGAPSRLRRGSGAPSETPSSTEASRGSPRSMPRMSRGMELPPKGTAGRRQEVRLREDTASLAVSARAVARMEEVQSWPKVIGRRAPPAVSSTIKGLSRARTFKLDQLGWPLTS